MGDLTSAWLCKAAGLHPKPHELKGQSQICTRVKLNEISFMFALHRIAPALHTLAETFNMGLNLRFEAVICSGFMQTGSCPDCTEPLQIDGIDFFFFKSAKRGKHCFTQGLTCGAHARCSQCTVEVAVGNANRCNGYVALLQRWCAHLRKVRALRVMGL